MAASATSASSRPLRVLVVEDDADSAEAFSMLLQRAGHRTQCVDTAKDALAALAGPQRPDVLLLDLTLRDLGGPTLLSAFEAVRPLPPTVVISAAPESTLRAGADRLHARSALRKPFGTETLLLAIAEAASARRRR